MGRTPIPRKIPVTPRRAADSISAVGGPTRRGSGTPWPIGDLYHARLALIYALSPSHEKTRKKILKAVSEHYPQYDWESWWNPRAEALGAPSWAESLARRNPKLKEDEPFSLVKPYITSVHVLGRTYDLHNQKDHNRGDCKSCVGTGVVFDHRHEKDPTCPVCKGTRGHVKSLRMVQDIFVIPPSLQGESIFFPEGIPFHRVLDSWYPAESIVPYRMVKAILVDDYKVFTEKEFRPYKTGSKDPKSLAVYSRFKDWQKKMGEELSTLERRRKIQWMPIR